jgi:hypothetical protein
VPGVHDVRENENIARNASVNGIVGKIDEVVGVGPHQESNVRMEDWRRPSLTINTSEYHTTISRSVLRRKRLGSDAKGWNLISYIPIPTDPDSVLENDIEGMNDPGNAVFCNQ